MTELLQPATSAADALQSINDTEGLNVETLSPGRMAWQRFWAHKGAAVSSVIMAILIVVVVFAPWTARYPINRPVRDLSVGPNINLKPQSIAWLGTQATGFDLYSMLIWGLRVSLMIGVGAAIVSVVIGTIAGSIAGLYGGRFDDALMRVTDVFLAFPFLVAVIVIRQFLGGMKWFVAIFGDKGSVRFLVLLFALFGWMTVARLVRGSVLALKEREYVEAARALGATKPRIVMSHLLPNSIGPILVAMTLSVTASIVAESTLSFFGLGAQPGQDRTSLGNIIQLSAKGAQTGMWWLVVFPCGLLVLVAVCINFIGDGLRDAFDPKMDMGS